MENNKITQDSKIKLRIDIPNVLKPFFNRITSFPNMVKKVDEASTKITDKESIKVTINDTPLELSKKEIKADKLETLIPEKYEQAQKSIPEKEIDKSQVLYIEDIKISPEVSKSISDYDEFGTGSIVMLEPEELAKIPDLIEGRKIADYEKMELLAGGLDFPDYGTSYNIENNNIVKTQLNEALVPEKSILQKSDVSFDNSTDMDRYMELGQRSVETNQQEFGLKPLTEKEENELNNLHNRLQPSESNQEQLVGKITIVQSGEEINFTKKEDFLKAFEKELDTDINGFRYENFDKTPEFSKAIDDLIYGEYGEDNPKKLEDYLTNSKEVINLEMSGGSIKDLAKEVLDDPSKYVKLDSNTMNVVLEYIQSKGQEKTLDMKLNKMMADIWAIEQSKPTELSKGMTNTQIDENQANFYRKYETIAKELNTPVTPFLENRTSGVSLNENQLKNFEHLERNVKSLGFSNDSDFKNELVSKLSGNEVNFSINQKTDKNFFKTNEISFDLNFHRSKETGTVFFNNYQINLENKSRNMNLSHNVNLKQIAFSAKEAVNLIEGRSVRTDINYTGGKKENVFVKLDFHSQKENGNYNLRKFFPEYGVNTAEILKKSDVFFAPNKEDIKDRIIKSLEKGNVVPVLIKNESGKPEKLNAVLNPHYKTLNLYNERMERVNEKKSLDVGATQERIQSDNTTQHSVSRKP